MIFGEPVSIVDRDESDYLSSLSGSFESDILSIFASATRRNSQVIDVGANIGLTSIAFGRPCPEGNVLAIEASPDTYGYLKKNIENAGLLNVACENLAASAEPGTLEIMQPKTFSAGGFIACCVPPHRRQFSQVESHLMTTVL